MITLMLLIVFLHLLAACALMVPLKMLALGMLTAEGYRVATFVAVGVVCFVIAPFLTWIVLKK